MKIKGYKLSKSMTFNTGNLYKDNYKRLLNSFSGKLSNNDYQKLCMAGQKANVTLEEFITDLSENNLIASYRGETCFTPDLSEIENMEELKEVMQEITPDIECYLMVNHLSKTQRLCLHRLNLSSSPPYTSSEHLPLMKSIFGKDLVKGRYMRSEKSFFKALELGEEETGEEETGEEETGEELKELSSSYKEMKKELELQASKEEKKEEKKEAKKEEGKKEEKKEAKKEERRKKESRR